MTVKRWIILFLSAAVLCIGCMLLFSRLSQSRTVQISQNGEVLYTIDLAKVDTPYEITVPYGDHYNTVYVQPGSICVREADCSNQVCVNHGDLQEFGTPITCLPHRLMICWTESKVQS
jgi:hypothetical protein